MREWRMGIGEGVGWEKGDGRWEGERIRWGSGGLGRFGHADRRALIDLKPLYYLGPWGLIRVSTGPHGPLGPHGAHGAAWGCTRRTPDPSHFDPSSPVHTYMR
jgi:hypothetical protein